MADVEAYAPSFTAHENENDVMFSPDIRENKGNNPLNNFYHGRKMFIPFLSSKVGFLLLQRIDHLLLVELSFSMQEMFRDRQK